MNEELLAARRSALGELADHIQAMAGEHLESIALVDDELVAVARPQGLLPLLMFLRDDGACLFKQMMDICGVDWPGRDKRFDVVYELLSMRHNLRLRLKVPVAEGGTVPSAVDLFSSAGWFEREAYDMFGILFDGNPDLRRILTDYGFAGHPLRKDFPQSGYVEVRYDEGERRVVQEPVRLVQEYRTFDTLSPWVGPQEPRHPGDGKAAGTDGS